MKEKIRKYIYKPTKELVEFTKSLGIAGNLFSKMYKLLL